MADQQLASLLEKKLAQIKKRAALSGVLSEEDRNTIIALAAARSLEKKKRHRCIPQTE